MKTDVLFVHPGNQKRIYQDLSKEFTAIATPVWTALLAESTRRAGLAVAIHDVNVEGWDAAAPRELLTRYNPELIVIMVYGHTPSASTQTMPAARMAAAGFKQVNRDLPVALGGIHPSSLPEQTLREEPVDYVIQGEGVYTIPALLDCLKGKIDRKQVPGLWYQSPAGPVGTPPAPIVENLDDALPGYAWDLLPDLGRYRAHNMHCFQDFERSQRADFADVRSPYVTLNTSLGCPYNCHYCCINAIFGKPGIRYWSLDHVLAWTDALVRRGVRHIRLDDELFILSPKRVERFCDLLIERKYNLNFWVYGRVDTIRDNLLAKLKKAGVNWICLGIESANAKVRDDVNKNIRTDIKAVVNKIQDHGIYVLGNYMFGLPEDTLATMEETLQLALDLNCEFANFYTVMALPGSRLYRQAVRQGNVLPPSWSGFSQHSVDTQPMPTRHLSAAQVLEFRDRAFGRYFSHGPYLAMVRRVFGPKVERHLQAMLAIPLERRLTSSMHPVSSSPR